MRNMNNNSIAKQNINWNKEDIVWAGICEFFQILATAGILIFVVNVGV